jgi:hypothetical protein
VSYSYKLAACGGWRQLIRQTAPHSYTLHIEQYYEQCLSSTIAAALSDDIQSASGCVLCAAMHQQLSVRTVRCTAEAASRAAVVVAETQVQAKGDSYTLWSKSFRKTHIQFTEPLQAPYINTTDEI